MTINEKENNINNGKNYIQNKITSKYTRDLISLTPNAKGTNQSKDVNMYVENRFACIVLRKQRRSLRNSEDILSFLSVMIKS